MFITRTSRALVLRIPVARMERSAIRESLAVVKSPGFHFVTSGLRSNGSSWLASLHDKTRLTIPGQSTLPVKLSSASLTGEALSPWSLPRPSALVGKIRQGRRI